jgi:cytochrome oxidase Cu insertion factor (SCO1/SenC/PrrC family)
MSSRVKLVLVLFIFIGPVVAAFFWYYGLGERYFPKTSVNNAPLVVPVVVLDEFSNPQPDGSPFSLDTLRGHWSLVHTLAGQCGEACVLILYNTRQSRLALGKDAHRVQRVLLSSSESLLQQLQDDHPDAVLLQTDENGLENQLAPVLEAQQASPDDVLVVDPLGNVMMRIPPDMDPGLILKDLKRLLKVSRIG